MNPALNTFVIYTEVYLQCGPNNRKYVAKHSWFLISILQTNVFGYSKNQNKNGHSSRSILKAFNKTNVFFAAFLKSLKIVNIAGENVAFIFHRKNVDTATLHLHQVRGG